MDGIIVAFMKQRVHCNLEPSNFLVFPTCMPSRTLHCTVGESLFPSFSVVSWRKSAQLFMQHHHAVRHI